MGFAMNSFDMLEQLRQDINSKDDTKQRFSKFILNAVIVHDPQDSELIDKIRQNFPKWSEETGDHFLFITFVNPTGEWFEKQARKDYFFFDKTMFLGSLDRNNTIDEGKTNYLLRKYMDLPPSGSFLMLTDKLTSNSFYQIPTSAESLESQLNQITNYCQEESEVKVHSPSDFNALIKNLKAEKTHHKKSFLNILSDYAALLSKISPFGRVFGRNRQENRRIELIQKEKEEIKNYDGKDWIQKITDLYFLNGEILKDILQTEDKRYRDLMNKIMKEFLLNEKNLDPCSNSQYFSFLIMEGSLFDFYPNKDERIDYSGLTIYLGNIIENELNLSVEQMLRHTMGIDMPEYFNKYSLEKGDVIIPAGNTQINVNQTKHKSETKDRTPLKNIPIGNLIYAYESMLANFETINPSPIPERFLKLDKNFIPFFRNFSNRFRNKAAHPSEINLDTYQNAKKEFDKFLNYYLEVLSDIRKSLQTGKINNSENPDKEK